MCTVKELIEHLSGFPTDAPVMLSTYACGNTFSYPYTLDRITLNDEGQVMFEAEDY